MPYEDPPKNVMRRHTCYYHSWNCLTCLVFPCFLCGGWALAFKEMDKYEWYHEYKTRDQRRELREEAAQRREERRRRKAEHLELQEIRAKADTNAAVATAAAVQYRPPEPPVAVPPDDKVQGWLQEQNAHGAAVENQPAKMVMNDQCEVTCPRGANAS